MSRVTPFQWSDNDGPQPHPVLSLAEEDEMDWLEYLPDGRRIVTGSGNGTVRVWNVESGEQEGTSMKHEGEMCGLAVTRDGAKIISCGWSGGIKVWDVESHKLVKEWTHPESHPKIAISPDDQLVAVGRWNVTIYSMEGRRVGSVTIGRGTLSMCFSPDGKKLACDGSLGTYVYDVNSGTLILGPLDGFVRTVLWSRDGSRLFSGSFYKTIRCWNSDTGHEIGHPWTGHTSDILSLSLSPDGSILASASLDKTVRFWDATTGSPVGQHLRHDREVTTVRFSPSGEFVASIGWRQGQGWEWNGMAYLWRAPWLNSADSQTGLVNPGVPCNTMRCTQVSLLNPPPYSTHTPSAEKELDSGLGLLMTAVPITSTVVPNTHPNRPIPNSNPDESDSLDKSSMSNEADLQYVLADMSLGLEKRQCLFESRLRDLVDLATSHGLHVPHDLVRSSLPLISRTELVESCHNLMHVTDTEPSTSVFRSTSNADPKRTRKIRDIKTKLIAMLREIGFSVPGDRLWWSTLEGELEKQGYTILHWPQGVFRENDKGVNSLGAEEADKLYRALFLDERRVQFVCRDDENGEGTVSLPDMAHSDDALESHHACMPLRGTPRKFRVTTQEAYSVERPHKRPRRA